MFAEESEAFKSETDPVIDHILQCWRRQFWKTNSVMEAVSFVFFLRSVSAYGCPSGSYLTCSTQVFSSAGLFQQCFLSNLFLQQFQHCVVRCAVPHTK